MTDSYKDDKGNLVVDLSSGNRASRLLTDRKKLTEYGGEDLASGFPVSMIWTTRDGRRIAVPNMSDSHLINTIQYLRKRVYKYKVKILTTMLSLGLQRLSMFDDDKWVEIRAEAFTEQMTEEMEKLKKLSTDEFLKKVWPIHGKMLQEAYKRKLAISEADESRVAQSEPKAPKKKRQNLAILDEEPIDAIEELAKVTRECEGCEVHKDNWSTAEAVVAKYPDEFSLGSPRGPDRAWKRLNIIGSEN